jgi:hypothetical protein
MRILTFAASGPIFAPLPRFSYFCSLMQFNRLFLLATIVIVAILIIDQSSKIWIKTHMEQGQGS